MNEKEIAILEADLKGRYEVIKQIYERITNQQPTFKDGEENLDSMAYQLHNLYGAYEELFRIVPIFFEGTRHSTDLLRRMKLEIVGVRPALLSSSTAELLDELRRFHHFFRHAYGIDFDADRVGRIVQMAIDLKEPFLKDMENFLEQLR